MSNHTCFTVDVSDGVAHIQMSRPDELNTMTREFWAELPELLRTLDSSGEVRAAVLSSAPGRHFCAGMHLANFGSGNFSADGAKDRELAGEAIRRSALELQEVLTTFERVRFPVLAAIQGGCVGGGVDMVTACDMRYCTQDAWFCIQEINIGMTADVGTLQRLPKLVAPGLVRQWAYTGERVRAEAAMQSGLVNQVFETHEAMIEGVLAIARTIASKPPLAILGTKVSLLYSRDHSVEDGLNFIATWNGGMLSSRDLFEGIAAQAEKREPEYENLKENKRYAERS
ncbi:MAG: crotonase/enoyl-CoA hydratase family protein [Gammaproteobacteria bacterium AqS3]|nr:crotonase/enoyl-CoA hydratase family protein [Gammaproteobacteria bacterium AqS3]